MGHARHERAAHRATLGLPLCATATLLAVGWIGFVGSLHLHEMLLGAVVVALCTAFCWLVYNSETLPFGVRLRDLAQGRSIPWSIVARCSQITWILLKDLAGQRTESYYRVCGFRCAPRNPIGVERAVLVVSFCTVAPNFIVIGIDPHQNHMLFHQIERTEVPAMARALGAGS